MYEQEQYLPPNIATVHVRLACVTMTQFLNFLAMIYGHFLIFLTICHRFVQAQMLLEQNLNQDRLHLGNEIHTACQTSICV